jgi:probable rRNA maturation factor
MPVFVRTTGLQQRPVSAREVRRRGERMLRALGLEHSELSVLLCDDDTIATLNKRYRRKAKPTDVLAFEQDGDGALLGDVVISIPTARRQARLARRRILDEVTMLLAHGLLHLLGFDHRTVAEDRRMRAKMDVLCTSAARP